MKTIDIKSARQIKEEETAQLKRDLEKAQKSVARQKYVIKFLLYILLSLIVAGAWFYAYKKTESWWLKRLIVTASPSVHKAQAKEVEPEWPDIGDCEQYRPIVEKYFGKLTDEALFVASKESGCIADRISPKNTDGSKDYCLFQITREPLAAQSLDVCVRRAWEKYKDGRVGEYNFSAWFAVCLKENTKENPRPYPVPKYPKIINNCD